MTELLSSSTFIGLLQAAGVGFLVVLAGVSQRFGKRKETAQPVTQDVMIPSVTVADRVALERLADTLRDSNRVVRDHREHDTEILYMLMSIKESNARMESLLGRMLDRIKAAQPVA